jgi:parallel beta-helix repeat protein
MNHWQKWAMAVLGGVALAAALALAAVGQLPEGEALALAQGTIYVDVDATGANDGSSWEDAYTTLQPALDEAVAGDEIWVAAGTYKPTYLSDPSKPRSATFQLKNGVALYGGFDPSVGDTDFGDRDWAANAAILSGDLGTPVVATDNSYHVFYHPAELALDATAVLDGFTVTGGYANGGGELSDGGGMYNKGCSPTVTHCTFAGNYANIGGGMRNHSSASPSLTDCTFSANTAGDQGGGMANYSSSPSVTNCTFAGNHGHNGGGMLNYQSSPEVIDCTFADNEAQNGSGGGIYNYTGSSPTLTNCTFVGNSAFSMGGGIVNYSAGTPTLTNCTFSGNSANTGGGIYDRSSLLTATNCILWGDTPDEIYVAQAEPVVTYSDVQGADVYPGTGNINADPVFEDAAMRDVDLLEGSPCIDAGTNDAPNLPATDFEGDPRIWDGDFDGTATADMGADEFAFHTLALHLAGNGSGSVGQTPEGARLEHGTVVTLTAIANTGSSFTEWSGDAVGTANPITLTMDTDKVVTATFAVEVYTLTISYAGNGSGLVSLDPPGGSYDYGTIVTLTAVADPSSSFTGWSGDAGGTTNPITLTMDADKAVTATFITYRVYLPLVSRLAP